MAIQTSFVKEAFEHAAQHTRKFTELMSAFPMELTKTYQEAWMKAVNAAAKTTETASQTVAANVERFSESIRKS